MIAGKTRRLDLRLDQMDFCRVSAEIYDGHGDGDVQPNPWIGIE